jgi:hypothetical protein
VPGPVLGAVHLVIEAGLRGAAVLVATEAGAGAPRLGLGRCPEARARPAVVALEARPGPAVVGAEARRRLRWPAGLVGREVGGIARAATLAAGTGTGAGTGIGRAEAGMAVRGATARRVQGRAVNTAPRTGLRRVVQTPEPTHRREQAEQAGLAGARLDLVLAVAGTGVDLRPQQVELVG